MHGRGVDTQYGRIHVVDPAGEPDALVRTIDFNRDLRGLTFDDDGDLWGIASVVTQSIVRIDPDTGEVLESFEVPDEAVYWQGMTFDETGFLYLLGRTTEWEAVIMRSPAPTASVRPVS